MMMNTPDRRETPLDPNAPETRSVEPRKSFAIPFLAVYLAVLVLLSLCPGLRFDDGMALEHYVLQAKGFLSGRAGLAEYHGPLNDVILFEDNRFIANPPFPAMLLMPFVAVLGDDTKGIILAALLLALAWFVLRAMATRFQPEEANWIAAAFILGTGLWFCFTQSDGMWFLAHTVSFTALLLAVYESLTKGRGWLAGLLLGASFLSRQTTLYSAIFLLAALWVRHREMRCRMWQVAGFALAFSAAIGFYCWFNWVRYGNPFDTGYSYLAQPEHLAIRQEGPGLFHWKYIPFNLYYLLFSVPQIEFHGLDFLAGWSMSAWGTSLTFASPFLVFALFSRLNRPLKWAAWLAIALTALHVSFYHANGWKQINCFRYALDFMPLLLVLCATAPIQEHRGLWRAGIIYAIALNALALVFVPLTNEIYQMLRAG
jgi:4-amino-4-deoxy-L-arabinose transferase-like glycosyltransferase